MSHMSLMGHLGADPEVRFTSSGKKVTTLRVATNYRRGGKEETWWWRVTVWEEQCDKVISYLKKGSAVIVHGEMLKPEIYTDRNGQPQVSLNIVAYNVSFSPFGKKEDINQINQDGPHRLENNQGNDQNQGMEENFGQLQSNHVLEEDEIPF